MTYVSSIMQAITRVKPYICTMPLRMDEGWNHIQLNLADFTRRAYGTNYVETLRVQVHANCRLRRIYFADRLYSEEELPPEFKLYLPTQVKFQYMPTSILFLHLKEYIFILSIPQHNFLTESMIRFLAQQSLHAVTSGGAKSCNTTLFTRRLSPLQPRSRNDIKFFKCYVLY